MLLTDDVHVPGHRIDWHTHPFPGCTFTVRGGYRERTARGEYTCAPGMWMLKPGDARHFDQYGEQPTRSLHLMYVTGERPDLDRRLERSMGVGLLEGGTGQRLGRRLVRALSATDSASDLAVEALLLELTALLCRQNTSADPDWVKAAQGLLDTRFREPIRLAELAADVGAEPAQLVRSFRRLLGVTPGEYLRRRRIEWADHQLRQGALTIEQVALQAGFYDRSHFVRAFTRELGRRPVRFRP
jgi:AraC-like DNA-binding protein